MGTAGSDDANPGTIAGSFLSTVVDETALRPRTSDGSRAARGLSDRRIIVRRKYGAAAA